MTSLQGSGIGTQWTYDTNTNDRRLLTVTSGPGTRVFGYKTTAENDVTSVTETLGSTSQTWTDTYDNNDRLLTAALSTGASYGYAYDKAGNITSLKNGSSTKTPSYNTLNEVKTFAAKNFVYDANGNLTQDDLHSYTYDAENRLVGIGFLSQPGVSESFRYDGNNHRVVSVLVNGATTTETHYFWCGQVLCEARNASDKVIGRYFAEGQEAPAAGTLLYYGRDNIGSVRDILNAQTGSLVGSNDYDPYGNAIKATGSANTDFRFAQLFYDKQSALYRGNFRSYDTRLGRWQSRDPKFETTGVNLYAYAGDNPMNGVDPYGLDTLLITSGWNGGYNIFGHSAVATTGNGVDSYGTPDPYGANATNYIQSQLQNRDVTITRIPTTPAQEQAIRDYYNKNYGPGSKYSTRGHNCANASGGALAAAGLPISANGIYAPGGIEFQASTLPGATTQTLTQGSSVPSTYNSFNPP